MKFLTRRIGALASLALAAFLLPAPAQADALIDNANGYTLDADGNLIRFTGLLFDVETGRVTRLLDRNDDRPRELDFRHDAQGQTVIPGLIDAHGHLMGLGYNAIQLDLSDTTSLSEAMARLAQYSAENPTLRWVVGRGWNQERWGLDRFPTAADLNAAVSDRPVWLVRVDGHAGVANSAAMAEAGVTASAQAPAGGRIERDGREPNGVFVDAAMALVERAIPTPQPPVRDMALRKAQELLLSYGVTTMHDMGTSADDWGVLRRAGDRNLLQIRVISYANALDTLLDIAGDAMTPWLYDGRLRMVGLKIYGDGALGSRGALLNAPYADAPGETGLALIDGIALRNRLSRLSLDRFQAAIHAIGDGANREALAAIEELASRYNDDRRWRIEHAQVVDPADLPRFGRNGIIASMQPVHQTSDRLMAEARLGPNRLTGAYAWNSMLRNGSRLAFGSDFPVENPSPFPGLAVAISRQDAAGQPAGGWQAHERVSLQQAFAAFTTDAAFAGFAEDQVGRLGEGLYADFLILDRDIFDATAEEIRATQVAETWIGGERTWVRGAADAPPMDAPVGPMISEDEEVGR
ncbi:amidohydrolase family protein [Parasphingopyxis algicola]|uniref:amidohydrolase n=1 Tax=Parasphingopyxis algicola TaxID=2026624 RepID=UPI001FE6A425|nr:amidohydrolase [Parasphingopyxis algicola]QLC25090.1 amidohydrolase family protein [Parasphingopyxis algicola]